jgi:hypothetical protein
MNTKKIVYGNGEGQIVDNDTKHKVIDYLYNKLDISKYRYIILNDMKKLKFLQDNEHYVAPNFRGYNYLLLMVTINDKELCIAIDRKKLSYHKNQLDMKSLLLIQLNMKTSKIMYAGTIFDGKLVQVNNEYAFVIQDCYYLMGNKLIEMEMSQKIGYLDSILKTHFKKIKNDRNYCNNFDFKLNKLYKYSDLEDLVSNLNNLSVNTNGIIFFPKFSGVNVIFAEKKNDKVEIINNKEVMDNKTYDIISNFVNMLKSRNYSYEINGKNKILWLAKTIVPDVYDVMEKENKDIVGIALIPNLKTSHMCEELIQDKPVKFKCIYSNKFKKWLPLNPA